MGTEDKALKTALKGIGKNAFRFKFEIPSTSGDTIYNAQLDLFVGLYIVAWLSDNNINAITYSIEDVIDNVKRGIWKMINNEGGR